MKLPKIVMYGVIPIAATVVLVTIMANITPSASAKATQPPKPAQQAKIEIKPEMIVKVAPGHQVLACLTRDLLNEFVEHATKGEKTKAEALYNSGVCAALWENATYKVLSVDYGEAEVLNTQANGSDGVWALSDWLVPARDTAANQSR